MKESVLLVKFSVRFISHSAYISLVFHFLPHAYLFLYTVCVIDFHT